MDNTLLKSKLEASKLPQDIKDNLMSALFVMTKDEKEELERLIDRVGVVVSEFEAQQAQRQRALDAEWSLKLQELVHQQTRYIFTASERADADSDQKHLHELESELLNIS